jgi:hypothetical protein
MVLQPSRPRCTMLDWLKKRRQPDRAPIVGRSTPSRVAVSYDDHVVRIKLPSGATTHLTWHDIGAVNIVTTAEGPFEPDLFWLLQSMDKKTNITIPMGAEGEHDLMRAMQARLIGFDNMAVVEAMSSTGPAGFVIWSPEHVDRAEE